MESKAESSISLDLSGELTEASGGETKKSLRQSIMALTLANPVAREWISSQRENVRPWNVFLDTKKFAIPATMSQCTKRVIKNIDHFQSNYLFVFLGLILYCVLTSPLLLLAIAAFFGACYIVKLKNETSRFHLFGRELSLAQQYGIISMISFPIFYIVGAGSIVFWVLGASFFIIMLHATMYANEMLSEEEEPFDLEMQPV